MLGMKLLIIHPDPAVLCTGMLERQGFIIEKVTTLSAAAENTAVYYYDIVIADIPEPDEDLYRFVSAVEKYTPQTGIIVISEHVPVECKIRALAEGADDYIVRPFNHSELLARVLTLVRRCSMGGVKEISRHGVSIDPARRRVECCGNQVTLTRKEYELLFFMLRNAEKILTHEMIAEYLWGDIKSLSADCFDFIYSHVKNIRKKLSNAGSGPIIDTVYGVGYVVR